MEEAADNAISIKNELFKGGKAGKWELVHPKTEENVRENHLDIGKNTILRHSTSTENIIEILKTLENGKIKLKAGPSGLVFCGVVLTDEQLENADNLLPKQCRYGPLDLEFTLGDLEEYKKIKFYKLGTQTRNCWLEEAQFLLANHKQVEVKVQGEESLDEFNNLNDIWIIKYKWAKQECTHLTDEFTYTRFTWVNPVVVFPKEVELPLEKVTISYSKKHQEDCYNLCKQRAADGKQCIKEEIFKRLKNQVKNLNGNAREKLEELIKSNE